MKVTFIRHGITQLNAESRYQGWLDTSILPLAENRNDTNGSSRHLLNSLKNDFSAIRFDRIFSSDLKRAKETAEFLFPEQDIELSASLRELSFGGWEGLTHEECMNQYHTTYTNWIDSPETLTPPDGESVAQLRIRVFTFLNDILCVSHTHNVSNIAVITHGGPIRAVIQNMLQPDRLINRITAPKPGECITLDIEHPFNINSI